MVSEREIRDLLAEVAASGEHSEVAELCRAALGEDDDATLRQRQDAWDRIEALLTERE